MQKRLWKCDGPNCTNLREQEWEEFALGGGWKSMTVDTGITYVDPVESHTRSVYIRMDFCSDNCMQHYKEQHAIT